MDYNSNYKTSLFPIDETIENYIRKYDQQQSELEKLARQNELQEKIKAKKARLNGKENPKENSAAKDDTKDPAQKPAAIDTSKVKKIGKFFETGKIHEVMKKALDSGKRILTIPELIKLKNSDLKHALWSKWCDGNTEIIIGRYKLGNSIEKQGLLVVHGPGIFASHPERIKDAIDAGLVNNWGKATQAEFDTLFKTAIPYEEFLKNGKQPSDYYTIFYSGDELNEIKSLASDYHANSKIMQSKLAIGLAGSQQELETYIGNVHATFNNGTFRLYHSLENADLSQAESLGRLGCVYDDDYGFYCDDLDSYGGLLGV